jgi:hypothetical protein
MKAQSNIGTKEVNYAELAYELHTDARIHGDGAGLRGK